MCVRQIRLDALHDGLFELFSKSILVVDPTPGHICFDIYPFSHNRTQICLHFFTMHHQQEALAIKIEFAT